jgi:hypothetical protein
MAWAPSVSTPPDPDPGPERAQRRGDARDQPAATDTDQDVGDLAGVLGELQAHGALPGDHDRIVERMN